jgi:hypothetical protein
MWSACEYLIDEIDKILLPEEEGNHEISRRCYSYICENRGAFATNDKANECGKVCGEDDGESFAIG